MLQNPSGIEIIPGVVYGNIASPTKIAFPATGFQTFGLNATRTIADTSPTIIPEIAPVVLKRFQYIVNKITGRFALAATANANDTKNATFNVWANNASMIDNIATPIDA